ncbi:unnamed protein product [Caretta caretta]
MTRKHGVRCLLVPASPHVETYVQALARVVGPTAIVAASKMYGRVVFFLASEAAAQEAVEKGLAVGGVFVPLEPLEDLGVLLVLTSALPFYPMLPCYPLSPPWGNLSRSSALSRWAARTPPSVTSSCSASKCSFYRRQQCVTERRSRGPS